MKRIRRIIISVIVITALFIIGSMKASACVRSIAFSGSSRRVNGHQSQWFNNGSVNYEGSVPSTDCFVFTNNPNDVVTVRTNGKIFQFNPHKIGTATVSVSVKSSCLCSGVGSITRSGYFVLSEWGLKSLSVDNYSISPKFYNGTMNYTLSVPYEASTINVKATPNQSNSSMTGTGQRSLNVGANKIEVYVKTPQGDGRTYTITVTRGNIISAQSIKINGGDLSLRVNDEKQLAYTINPTNATIEGLTWTSSDPSVVSVSSTGKIKTLKAGDAKIKLQLNNLSSEINVHVTKSVTSIDCTDAMILNKNLKYQLEYTVLPKDATNKEVTFSVNNNLISISKDGIITVGNKTGTSILTITSVDSGIKKDVTVIISSDLESISFSNEIVKMKKGETLKLIPIFKPSDVVLEAEELTWASENSNVAIVSDNGTITAVSKGETTISAEFKGVSKEVKVFVFNSDIVEVNEITAQDEITLFKETQEQIDFEVLPENASIKDVTFSVNNDYVTVSDSGLITAGSKAGTSIITISSYDGSVKKTVKVTVTDEIKVTDIDAPKDIKVYKGEKFQVTCEVFPDDATNKTLYYSVDNNLLSISQTGLITAGDKPGKSVVTVSSHDGSVKKTVNVEIMDKIEKLVFEKSSYEMKVNDRLKLKLKVTPSDYNLDYTTITWESSDNSIVEISRDGTAIAKKGGYVTIKATSEDGTVTAASSITVPSEEASVGKIILVILICISIPVGIIAFDYFRKNKR